MGVTLVPQTCEITQEWSKVGNTKWNRCFIFFEKYYFTVQLYVYKYSFTFDGRC